MKTLSHCQLMERCLAAEARVVELGSGKVGNALLERENHHVEVVGKLTERIAELESRTVKLPAAVSVADWMVGIDVYEADLVLALLAAAGIKVEAE